MLYVTRRPGTGGQEEQVETWEQAVVVLFPDLGAVARASLAQWVGQLWVVMGEVAETPPARLTRGELVFTVSSDVPRHALRRAGLDHPVVCW